MIPRVSMIGSGYDGCNYVRIMLPAWHNGFYLDRPTLTAPRGEIKDVKDMLDRSDVVVFHRPEKEEYHALADMLIRDGKKVVMDNDDTFRLEDYHPLAGLSEDGYQLELNKRNLSIDSFAKKAHLVTVSTKPLADEYRQLNPNTIVLPNCVDLMDWDTPLKNSGEKVRIGMVGSVAYEHDYKHIKALLRKLSKRKDITLVMFGFGDKKHRKENPTVTKVFAEEYAFWDSLEIEHISWKPMAEYQETLNNARLDLMLIPRKETYFNKCKSNIKVLEAAMLEIPCVVQSFPDGPYEEFEHNENVIKIYDNKNWEKEVDRMIADNALRRNIGRTVKQYVLNHYNIEDKAHLWLEAYQALL